MRMGFWQGEQKRCFHDLSVLFYQSGIVIGSVHKTPENWHKKTGRSTYY